MPCFLFPAFLSAFFSGEAKDTVIRQLDVSFLEEISGHYSMGSKEYVQERLESGNMFGAFIDGKLAGFAGEHIEGSIGIQMFLLHESTEDHPFFRNTDTLS